MTVVRNPTILRLNGHSYPISEWERQVFDALDCEVTAIEGDCDEEILAHATEADVVLVVSGSLSGRVIQQFKRCRVISRYGIGTDRIDVEAATRHGIIVTNIPGFSCQEVADHAMAFLLTVARKISFYEKQMRGGIRPTSNLDNLHRLSACTLGIIGFGQIGQHIARRALGFGMRTIACDPHFEADQARYCAVEEVDLLSLLTLSDYVVLACPLLPETRGMIAMDQLRTMKRSAVLINVARGDLVNEDDLVCALREKVIRFAALDVFGQIDVFDPKGIALDHPLFSLDNVLLTPHVSASSHESRQEMSVRGARNAADVLRGLLPESIVNPTVKPWFWNGAKRDIPVCEIITKQREAKGLGNEAISQFNQP